ncbi:MAG: mucoidy inhibitor MuiA family protein [Cyanobacteriota bacterium]
MNKTVDTRICEVTVYSDQALVTRRGVVQLTGEEQELVITQLPVTLQRESVRARSTNQVGGRLSAVRTERSSTTKEVAEQLVQINQEIGEIEEQKRQGQDSLTLLNLQRNFVKSLISQYLERLTKFPNPEEMSLNQIRELLDFVRQQYNDLSTAIAQHEKEQKQLDKQLQTLRQRLQQLSNSQSQESFSIIINLEPDSVGELELEVSYVVSQVSWVPLYDLRFNPTSAKINITYLAEVKQNTGEDWTGVSLTVSTAKSGLGILPPKLTPWYIDAQSSLTGFRTSTLESVNLPSRSLAATMPFAGTTPISEAAMNPGFDYGFASLSNSPVSKQGGSVTYKVKRLSNIPSDGTPHRTTIFNEDFPCRAEYIALPQQLNLAYLQVTMTNPSTGVTLLSGKVNIFLDNTFVGTTQLGNISPSQEFKLNLGIDEGLKIQRELVERQVEQKLIDNQRRITYAYRLLITNLRECQVELRLTEQLPVSRHEQIQVHLTFSNPEIQMGEMGILVWSVTLPPLSKQELYYQYTVEYPSELTVFGLDL